MNMKKYVCVLLTALSAVGAFAATTTKTVTWELPAGWDADVTYPMVEGYRAIVGPELLDRLGLGKVAEPDLPYYRIRIALPSNGTFGDVTAEAEWSPVDLDSALPMPIPQPVPMGDDIVYPTPGAAYETSYPSTIAKAEYLQIANGVRMMPITVTPFRWDGQAKQLYKAKTLKVTATYTVPKSLLRLTTSSTSSSSKSTAGHPDLRKMALSMTINPNDATTASSGLRLTTSSSSDYPYPAYDGDDRTADFIIISPHNFIDLWKKFVDYRKTTVLGQSHTFAIKDADDIYEEFKSDADDQLRIHHYLERIYALGKIKYVLLGAAPVKYNYNPKTMIPTRTIVSGGSLAQIADMYYGCMDRMPVGVGVEVWDYDGDGAYLGHKNSNGSYSSDSNDKIDWVQDIIVFRFPLMERVVDTGYELTAQQIMDNFIERIKYSEGTDFPGKYNYNLNGSTAFRSSTKESPNTSLYSVVVDEREFFDGLVNHFDPSHGSSISDSEMFPRDRHFQLLTYLRGNREYYSYNSSQSNISWAEMYSKNADVMHVHAHGWARGCSPGNGPEAFTSSGHCRIWNNAGPCDSGMMDYCPSGSYGITNCICFGEAPILAKNPHGGGLASMNNTRLGWFGGSGFQGTSGEGSFSSRMEWLIFKAMSGVTEYEAGNGYRMMDAGEALMWAKNNYGWHSSSTAWFLAGLEVTGQGDPLAKLTEQECRVWNGQAGNYNWSTNDANWSIPGRNGSHVLDVSRDLYASVKDAEGDVTFTIDEDFTSAGLFVEQNTDATLTLTGNGTFKTLRETVITNGNVRWEVAGGAGRNGITFVGQAGRLTLPGNNKRYFGERFSNVGTISVSGGNVVIDTPRNASFSAGSLGYNEIEFVAADKADVTEWNQLRSRNAGIFKTNPEKHLRVVNSKLILQTYNIGGSGSGNKDKPLIYATNSTIKVQANPRYLEEYFVRPTYLNNSEIVGDYNKFAFGPSDNKGYDLYVSGKSVISGDVPIKLNGELRIHFEDATSELVISNSLCNGTTTGSITFVGTGKAVFAAPQTFGGTINVLDGVTVETTVADAFGQDVVVKSGGTLTLGTIPLSGLPSLTVEANGSLKLPGATYTGTYKIVDVTTTTLDLQNGCKIYDGDTLIEGELRQGHYILTANVLTWRASGETWNKNSDNTTAWLNSEKTGVAYTDNTPLAFGDLDLSEVQVYVGENVQPGFVDFRSSSSRYVFSAATGTTPEIMFNSLVLDKPATFDVKVTSPSGVAATGSEVQFADIVAPKVEVASGGYLRATGTVDIASQKIKRLKFSFTATRESGNAPAVQELRLFRNGQIVQLPVNTVVRDIAGQSVTITGTTSNNGHTMTGNTNDEDLGALFDGKVGSGGNKWWPSRSSMPCWFEIEFSTLQDPFDGYAFCNADQMARDPKDWTVYASPDADGRYSPVSEVTGAQYNSRRSWMIGNGTASGNKWQFSKMTGLVSVMAGGTLVLDGTWNSELDLRDGSVLAVTNKCALKAGSGYKVLTLPSDGTVTIDFARAAASSESFPVLTGFGITAEQFGKFVCGTETAMLLLKDGDIYVATENVMVPPYTATVSSDTTWNNIQWKDKNNNSFTWTSAHIKADGTATITVSGTRSVSMDAVGTIAKLTVNGTGSISFNKVDNVTPIVPATLDASGITGTLTWNVPIDSTAVVAGSDTVINGGSAGTGKLTVGAGKKVTLGNGVTFANRDINATGWVRFAGERGEMSVSDLPNAVYSFEDATLTGSFELPNWTIKSAAGDHVQLFGTNDNFNARSLINFAITGGLVEVLPNGESTWFGRTATSGSTAATTFTQSGGIFRCTADGTGTGSGLLIGYTGGTDEGEELTVTMTGGLFEVPNSFLNFGNPTVFNLSSGARLKAKGFASSMSKGTITLGTGANTTDSATLEIGALGFQKGAAAITMRTATEIVGFEQGAYLSENVILYGYRRSTSDAMTIAATNGAQLILRDMAFESYTVDGEVYNGSEAVMFGKKAKDYTGEVVIESETCLPKSWTVNAGSVNVGKVRAYVASTLTAQPTDGKVIAIITQDEFNSGASSEILHCGDWANALTSEQLRSFIVVKIEQADGSLVVDTTGKLRCSNGIVEFIPAGAAGYLFPVSASVTADADWTKLDWYDRNGVKYTNDWQGVVSAELVSSNGAFAVTMDKSISMKRLTTRVTSGKTLTLNAGDGKTLALTDKLDDSASVGTTVLHIALGEGMTVSAGKSLKIDGASNSSVAHGKLIIGPNSQVTVVDGYWNGEVEMSDTTSKLRYESTVTLDAIPSALNSTDVGLIEYAAPMVPANGVASFGSSSGRGVSGTYYFRDGTSITANEFLTGVGNGTSQQFRHYAGTVTVNNGGDIVIGEGTGSEVSYYLWGGDIIAPDSMIKLGLGGGASQFNIRRQNASVSTCRVKGLTTGGVDNKCSVTFLECCIDIGAGGIDIDSSVHDDNVVFYPMNMMPGTISSYEDTSVDIPNGIGVYETLTLAPSNSTVMTVNAPFNRSWLTAKYQGTGALVIDADGRVDLESANNLDGTTTLTAGTLRLKQKGLLKTSKVVFGNGSIEVLISEAEARTASTYTLFTTDAALNTFQSKVRVLVEGSENVVDGTLAKSGVNVTFKPTILDGISVTISADKTCDWTAAGWTYSNGTAVPASAWNSVIGSATLNNSANATLTFGGNCLISSLIINNTGTLDLAGDGTMSAGSVNASASTGTVKIGSFLETETLVAGKDTVISERHDYTINNNVGKLTIPGWMTPSKVSGTGVVALDMGARDTVVGSYWSKDAGITGTNQIVRGTWEFTANSQYPNGKEILVTGADAVLRIKNSNDITGYSGVSGAITVEDGGEFQVYKRDTFSRTLYLRNGGKLLMNNDNNDNSGRSQDFYSGSTIIVSGQTPSVIGGTEATADSFGNPTVKSGIIAIRRKDFTIDVAKDSTLKVYSRWNTADGNSGSFIKTGAGVWEQYRESGSALPFVIQQGTLRLINGGTVTTAGISNAGVLEIVTSNGCEKTMANVISGSGSLVKNGPGTLTITVANTYTGATTINSGTVRLGAASATFGSGAVTIAEGVMLDIGTTRPSAAMLLNGELTATVKQTEKDGEQWVTLCTLLDGSTVTIDDLTVYDVDGTTELDGFERQIVDDKVQIRCQAYKMPISLKAYNSVESDWTQADWQDANNTLIPAAKWAGLFGRTNLAVEVYAYNGNAVTLDVDAAADLALFTISDESGKVTLRKTADGYGFASDATVLDGTLQVYDGVNLGAISGGGTLIATNFVPAYAGLADATKWTGILQLWDVATNELDFASIMNSGSKVVLNGVTVTTSSTIPENCKAEVTAGTVFKTAGLTVNGELTVTQNATTPIDGDVTFGAAGRLNLTMGTFATSVQIATGTLTMPSSVTVFINGVERPAGTWTTTSGAINLPFKSPFKATVTENAEWTALAWQDSSDTPVAVHPGFWATSTGDDNVELTVNAGATLTAASEITVGTVKVTGSGAVVLPTSNFTMGDLWGDGIVAVNAAWTTYTGITDSTKWTGTLKFTGNLPAMDKMDFASYGNVNSKIEIAGTTSGHLAMAKSCSSAFIVSGTFKTTDGGSNGGGYEFKGALSGNGTIWSSGNPTDVFKFTGNVSAFAGAVKVEGGRCIAFGDQSDDGTTEGKIVVNRDVSIASGKQWTSKNGVVVRDGKTLTMTSGTTPVSGNVTFEGASTLKLTDDGSAESYTIATGTLTLSDTTVIKFGDTVASRTDWFVVGGNLVKPTPITVTSDGTSLAGHDGHPISVTGVADGYALVSAAISPSLLLAKGDTLTIKYTECGSMTLAGGLVAGSTSVSLDASGMNGTELAKNAVRGAPYSHWLVKGAISGTVEVTNLPTMPTGYKVEKQILNDYGVRLIIKAPDEAMFGAVSVNVRNGAALESTDTLSGLYPVARKYWGDLQASAGKSVTVSNVTATIGTSASAYGISNDPSDMILKQYMDDSVGVTRTITVAGITYPKYRVIVYFSTDSTTINFRPAVINGVSYSATPAGTTSAAISISGATGDWGNTGPNHNAYDLCEGVNALISDVMTAGTATIAATRISNPGSRATIAAIQIVKVGEIAVPTTPDEPFILTIAGAAGAVDWKSAEWIGDNEVAVPSTAWNSAVGEAKIVVEDGGSATVNAASAIEVGSLKVVNAGTLAVGGSLSLTTLDDSESTGVTTAGGTIANVTAGANTSIASFTGTATIADAKKLTITSGTYTDSQFAITGTGALNVAGGTMDAPVVINDSASQLNSKTITIAASSVLKTAITDNRTYLITGAGATSKLILAGTKNIGLYEGTQLRNLTLVVDSSSYNTWIEHRDSGETDSTVDVEILNSSPVVIGGGVVPIGSLAGNGNLSINGSSSLDIHMDRSATTYSGASAVPMTVSGSYPLTLTGANTCALTVNAGATVILADGGKVGSATGAGTVTVNAGTLNVAIGSTLALTFADNTTLNLTGTLTAGGTFPFASSVTGEPNITLNGGALPSYCKIEGNNLVVTPEQKAWNNPVTGAAQDFSYAFFGSSDTNWTTIGNWREYGTISWNTMTGTAPMLSGSNRWNPTVIDGDLIATDANKTITLSGTNMEGWTPRLALFNGVNVTIGNMTKLQSEGNGVKWVWVDGTSKLTFTQIASGNFSHDFKLYVAGKDGLTFTQAIPKDGTTFEYYLSTNGTVKYEADLTKCSHTIKQFCLTLDKPSNYKIIKERTLVTYPSASVNFTTNSITVPAIGDITPTNLGRAPTTADDFGAYGVVKGDTALVVKYVDYSQFYTNLADNAEIAVSTINTLAATAGTEPYHVVFGKGVTVEFDEEFASNVVFDFTKMTADSTFVKTGDDEFEWSDAFASFTGTFDIHEGVMTIPTNTLANALTVSGGTLNLSIDGDLVAGTTYTITSGTMTDITKDDLTVNGEAIPTGWKLENGQLSKIAWTYPLTLAPTGNFTTATAVWQDSSSPALTYCDGFDSQVTSMQVDGLSMSGETYWTNDATTLNVGTLSFFYVSAADLHLVNVNGCNITANTIDASGLVDYYGDIYLTNEKAIHLEFATGSAAITAGSDTWLYGNGSGTITLNDSTQVTFYPQAGTNLTYSGAITGTGKLVKDGAGTLTLTGANTFTGGFTVKQGTVVASASGNLGTDTVTVKSGATLTLGIGSCNYNLAFEDGAKLDLIGTLPDAYTITSGSFSGNPIVTVNGSSIDATHKVEGNTITRRVYVAKVTDSSGTTESASGTSYETVEEAVAALASVPGGHIWILDTSVASPLGWQQVTTKNGTELLELPTKSQSAVAFWDNDFTGADGTDGAAYHKFAIKANGNTLAADKSTLTISQENGVLIDWDSSLQTAITANGGFADKNITILVRYSNLKGRSSNYGCLGTLFHSDDSTNHYDYAGIMTDMSNASEAARNKAYGIVNSVFWSGGTYQRQAQVPVEASDEIRTLAIVYNPGSAGTECYISQDGTNYTAYLQSTGLKTTSASYLLRGAALGGVRNTTVGNVKGMTGLNIHAVAVFNTVLTAGEMATFRFPSESEKSAIAYNVTWGNVGSSKKGVATSQDGSFGNTTWKVKFAADDNIVSELNGKYGFVNVKSLRLMKRNGKDQVPTSVTLTQGDISVTSGAPTTETGMNVYDTSGTALLSTAREGAVFTFDASAKFDVTKEITLTLNGNNGSSVMQPANSVMKYTTSTATWSPILEFTMDEYAARIEPVYMLNYYHADGQQQDGWINHTQTGGANITAPSSNGVSFVVYGPSGNNYKADAVSVPSANFSTGSYVDIHGKAHASLLDEIAASAGVDVSQVLKTGLANGASGAGTATATGLTVGQRYVVYFGFGVCGSADPNNGFTMLTNGYGTLDSLDYVVTGAGQNTAVATQYTSFTAGTNVRTANNAMMMVRAVLTPTSDGEIKINLAAGRSAISFVVISKITKDITEYTATVSKDTDFADIVWTPTKPASGFGADDVLTITALNNPTITFAETVTTEAKLTIDGAVKIAAADSLYDDDLLVHKTLAAFDKITAPNLTFATLKSGYQGAYTQTDSSIVLHAQSGEIISLNIAGGDNASGTSPDAHKTTGTDYYGLAPVQGNTWINQTDKWASSATKNFPSVVATADGSTTIDRSAAITATCAANNTYLWNSATDPFLKGYLDDGGTHAQVTVTGLQYPTYDVIVYFATDTAGRKFDAVTVNGTSYVYDSANPTTAKAGTGSWGLAQSKTAVYGTNALRVRGLSDTTLTIVGGLNDNSTKRGGIAAVQIVATNPWPIDGKIVIRQGDVDLGTRRGDIEVQGTATVKFQEVVNDCGAITLTVSDPSKVTIVRADGTTAIATTATDNGDGTYTFSFEPQLDGKICWWDYEFNGAVTNAGTDTTSLSFDGDRPFKDDEYVDDKALRVPSRPYREVSWPTDNLTFVIYGKMVSTDNAYQLCFGTAGGNLIFLATGSVASNEVVLCLSKSGTVTKLKTMTVPNAQTADHLYAFTLKTVASESVIDIYLDGQLLESYNAGATISLGGGFQIASPHGGVVGSYVRTADNDTATIDFLRVYKDELSAAAMKAYAEKYPYVSPNGSYTRAVDGGEVTWKTDNDSWQKKGEGGGVTNTPAEKATVELTATDDTTVTMELTKDVTYEAMTLDGDGEVTITNATDSTGQVKITGRLTVNTDATIDPKAIDIANTPITVAAGKTLTIDMTDYDLDEVLQTTTYKLTGLVSGGDGSEVAVATNECETIAGRTIALAPNADQHYELKVEVVPEEVTLALDLDNDSKEVSFSGTDALDIPLDWTLQLTNTAAQVLKDGEVTKTTVAAALNSTEVENGIKPWESYVLTLSPTNALSKPVIAPIQGTETDKVTFALDNVAVRSEVSDKVDVTYKVYSGTTRGAKTEASESVAADKQIKIDLPDSGVKYYHLEVDIAPKK